MPLKFPLILLILASISCAAPVLVPTAVPLPSPSPTWTLLPSGPPTEAPINTSVAAIPSETPQDPTETVQPTATEILFECEGAPMSRLQVGEFARVTFTDGLPLRVRSSPEVLPNNVTAQLPEGTVFSITAGPVCAAIPNTDTAFVFWQIFVESSELEGWVAEGDGDIYYIEPLP